MTTATSAPLLRARGVAERLGVSENRAYSLLASGAVPGVVRIGRSVRLPADALEAFIANGGTAASADD
ncbi:helix-turn-helix domain-containing protein [Microbacterium lushaniae]|nr:helix-turn-helix domain-containing protein [Microbacterium lushaniae]KAA9149504.1 helix-turn-helix domain-containing protein [Microbacterium lushaniae]